ncbi:MAG: DUF5678 domain-containing protein [Endomicrobium sp.]|nr:DUF5678 domain-containing protein [Endomicrobium sp.]
MVDKNYEYFSKNMPELYKKYGHKFLAIKDEKVIGEYDTFDEAIRKTNKTEKLGTFLIQECFENEDESAHHFQGNVSFDFHLGQ